MDLSPIKKQASDKKQDKEQNDKNDTDSSYVQSDQEQ